jgi:hypothetical protein
MVTDRQHFNSADYGILTSTILFILAAWGPVILIRAGVIKIRNRRPVYYMPKPWKIGLGFLAATLGILGALIACAGLAGDSFTKMLDADGFMSGIVMMTGILLVISGPAAAFYIFVNVRYKHVVEYGPEWRRHSRSR